jgi:hypothetical protein
MLMSKAEDTLHHVAAGRALMWLAYNRSTEAALRMAYGDGPELHPDYLASKARIWDSSPLRFLAQLDGPNSVRFWRGCMDVYAEDAYHSARHAMDRATESKELREGYKHGRA